MVDLVAGPITVAEHVHPRDADELVVAVHAMEYIAGGQLTNAVYAALSFALPTASATLVERVTVQVVTAIRVGALGALGACVEPVPVPDQAATP